VVGQPGEGLRGEAKGGGVEGLQVRGGFPMQVHVVQRKYACVESQLQK
jgi:hypothetical protein